MIRLITIPKIMSIVVETVFKKSNFILFSGLNRAANKIGDACQLLTVKKLFHSVILESAVEKGRQHTDQSRHNDSHYPIWCNRQVDAAIFKK